MKSAQRKPRNANIAGLQPVPVAVRPTSPRRSFEQVLQQSSLKMPRVSKAQRQISWRPISWLRSLPWPNRVRANAPQHLAAQPLRSAWAWIKRNYVSPATKRLRVAETVSLGEKRFVAIVRVDGREFLIGGGTSGISLLAPITKPPIKKRSRSPRAKVSASVMQEVSQ